jgi:hypothetical protein
VRGPLLVKAPPPTDPTTAQAWIDDVPCKRCGRVPEEHGKMARTCPPHHAKRKGDTYR